jgi:hypothetical protein
LGGKVTAAACDPSHHPPISSVKRQLRADAVSIAFRPLQLEANPRPILSDIVAQENGSIFEADDGDVRVAVIVEVSHC